MKLSHLLLAASLLCVAPVATQAAPPTVTQSTASVVIGQQQTIVFPADRQLPHTFTAATRATVAPVVLGQLGWEVDTGIFYISDGTNAGDWVAYTLAFSSVIGKPTTLSGYGIADAQPLDSDLTAIAGVTTTSFGRGLLDEADASALRTTLSLVPGSDVQAYDADIADLADGTLTGTKVQRQMSVDADASGLKLNGDSSTPGNSKYYGTNASGTKGFHDLPEGGGGGGQLSEWAYVDPANGNDTSGDGTAGDPWASLQHAVVAGGREFIVLAPGNAGNLEVSTSKIICITGAGRDVTTVGSVTATNGASITLQDVGGYSFSVTGNIVANGPLAGGYSGGVELIGVFGPSASCLLAGTAEGSVGAAGGGTGNLSLVRCEIAGVTLTATDGAAGDCSTVSGDGGSLGTVTLHHSKLAGSVDGSAGNPGSDGGAGQGNPGGTGTLAARFSEYSSTSLGTTDVKACLVGGTWTD